MIGLTRLRGTWSRAFTPLLFVEAVFALASVCAALILLQNQTYFDHRPGPFWLIAQSIFSREWEWGALALLAGGFKSFGLGVCLLARSHSDLDAAFYSRGIGWGLSVIFWGSFALSFVTGDLWRLGAVLTTVMCSVSIRTLMTGPLMPDDM